MLMVKVMSGEDLADDDSRKQHALFTQVTKVDFVRDDENPDWAVVNLVFADNEVESVEAYGNVYVMNENGKTVTTFTA